MSEAYGHLKTAADLKSEGNEAFRASNFATAVAKYQAALRKEKEPENRAFLLSNSAMALVKLQRWEEAINAATGAINLFENKQSLAKALVSRAKAFRASSHRQNGAELAKRDLQRAAELVPNDKLIADLNAEKSLGTALKKSLGDVYPKDEAKRRHVEEKPQKEEPPKEWVLKRMHDALERQRKNEPELEAFAKAYVQTETGSQTPSWSLPRRQEDDPKVAAQIKQAAVPTRVPAAPQQEVRHYNRGYKEVDTTTWCLGRLRAHLRPVQAKLKDATARDGVGGIARIVPSNVSGDAVMIRVGEKDGSWEHGYDLQAKFDFEARLGPPRTVEVEMKGQKHRIFKGVPTIRGALVVREFTHLDGPDEAVIELQWGYGGSLHFEKDEIGMSKAHATALRALLGKPSNDSWTVQSAVVEMLRAFVTDYRREMPEPRPKLNDVSLDMHLAAVEAALAVDRARHGLFVSLPGGPALEPWTWEEPAPPKTDLDIDPNSKLAKLHGIHQNEQKVPSPPPTDDTVVSHAGDDRGGFSHTMLEQFESLNTQGYTVLLGAAGPEPQQPPKGMECDPTPLPAATTTTPTTTTTRPGTLDYSKFDALDASDDSEDEEVDEDMMDVDDQGDERRRETKIKGLDTETQDLWKAIMKIADGDVIKAQELIKDPDSLQEHPIIADLLAQQQQQS